MTIKLTSGNINIVMDSVSDDATQWKVIQNQDYRPDRDQFLLNKFKSDFPQQANAVNDFEMVARIASRSKAINDWLQTASLSYVLDVSEPRYLVEVVKPEDYKDASVAIQKISELNERKSNETQELAIKYQKDLKAIEDKYNKLVEPIKGKNNVIKALSLNSQDLPLTLQLMIENYVPSQNAGSPDRRTYAREVLTNYKIALIKYCNEHKDVNFDVLIKDLSTK